MTSTHHTKSPSRSASSSSSSTVTSPTSPNNRPHSASIQNMQQRRQQQVSSTPSTSTNSTQGSRSPKSLHNPNSLQVNLKAKVEHHLRQYISESHTRETIKSRLATIDPRVAETVVKAAEAFEHRAHELDKEAADLATTFKENLFEEIMLTPSSVADDEEFMLGVKPMEHLDDNVIAPPILRNLDAVSPVTALYKENPTDEHYEADLQRHLGIPDDKMRFSDKRKGLRAVETELTPSCHSTKAKRSPFTISAATVDLEVHSDADDMVMSVETSATITDSSILAREKKDSGLDLVRQQTTSQESVPRFYFPLGNPSINSMPTLQSIMSKLEEVFCLSESNPQGKCLGRLDMWPVMDACSLPRYASFALFSQLRPSKEAESITFQDLSTWLQQFAKGFHDTAAIMFKLILHESTRNYLTPDDFNPLVEEVVQRHPGLEFLSTMPIFQSRYVETVAARIFYSKNCNSCDRMSLAEFRKHQFLDRFKKLQEEDDINAARDIFSYKHFYVIYCKFWELDTDHDMVIEGDDMYRYDRHALTPIVIDRILSGSCKPLSHGNSSRKLSYKDFIWFMLCAEDKRTVSSVEYWFRCLDSDGDGKISLYELQSFYDEQFNRMLEYRMSDPWKYGDFVCSLLDLVKPKDPSYITLADLKKCSNTPLFFDMIFDIRKYDMHIRRIDPTFRELDDIWIEDSGRRYKLEGWDKYAERAYDQLALEESGQRTTTYRSTIDYEGGILGDAGYDLDDLDEEWENDDEEGVTGHWSMSGVQPDSSALSGASKTELSQTPQPDSYSVVVGTGQHGASLQGHEQHSSQLSAQMIVDLVPSVVKVELTPDAESGFIRQGSRVLSDFQMVERV